MRQQYTVLLLYPDYLTSEFGETFLAHVSAPSEFDAVECAQLQAAKENQVKAVDGYNFKPLAVFVGHLQDIKP